MSSLYEQVYGEIKAVVINTLEDVGDLGVTHAKRLAPVRKVFFSGRRAVKRDLNRAEIAALPRSIRQALVPNTARFGPNAAHPGAKIQTTVVRSGASRFAPVIRLAKGERGVRFPASARDVVRDEFTGQYRLASPENGELLTSRGRYELSHAGPIASEGGLKPGQRGSVAPREPESRGGTSERTLGGTLRREIGSSWIDLAGPRFVIQIESPEGGQGRSAAYSRYVELPTSRTAAQPYLRPTLQYLKRPLVQHLKRNLSALGRR
jgi:hypothetical protein